jgi:lysophospholipase L1-like esterase
VFLRALKALSLVLASIFLTLVAVEVGMRLFTRDLLVPFAPPKPGVYAIRKSEIPNLDYDLMPNFETTDDGVPVKTNSLGFRDREFSEDSQKYRIVALGDSITFGTHVRVEESFAKVLERKAGGPSAPLEVINMGMTGYNTIDEARFLAAKIDRVKPRLVILGICVNDAGVQAGDLSVFAISRKMHAFPIGYSRLLQFLKIRTTALKARAGFKYGSPYNDDSELRKDYGSHLGEFEDPVLDAMMQRLASTPADPGPPDITRWYESKVHVGVMDSGLQLLKQLSEKHQVHVVAMLVPFLDPGNRARWRVVSEIIAHEVGKYGFDWIDATASFEKFGMEKLRRPNSKFKGGWDTLHPNARGHEILADLLLRYLRTTGVAARK